MKHQVNYLLKITKDLVGSLSYFSYLYIINKDTQKLKLVS